MLPGWFGTKLSASSRAIAPKAAADQRLARSRRRYQYANATTPSAKYATRLM